MRQRACVNGLAVDEAHVNELAVNMARNNEFAVDGRCRCGRQQRARYRPRSRRWARRRPDSLSTWLAPPGSPSTGLPSTWLVSMPDGLAVDMANANELTVDVALVDVAHVNGLGVDVALVDLAHGLTVDMALIDLAHVNGLAVDVALADAAHPPTPCRPALPSSSCPSPFPSPPRCAPIVVRAASLGWLVMWRSKWLGLAQAGVNVAVRCRWGKSRCRRS